MTNHGGGVGFFIMKDLPAKTVDAPTFSTFETLSYQLHTLFPLSFLMISCFSLAFCHISFVDILMFMWIQIASTKENFSIYWILLILPKM